MSALVGEVKLIAGAEAGDDGDGDIPALVVVGWTDFIPAEAVLVLLSCGFPEKGVNSSDTDGGEDRDEVIERIAPTPTKMAVAAIITTVFHRKLFPIRSRTSLWLAFSGKGSSPYWFGPTVPRSSNRLKPR